MPALRSSASTALTFVAGIHCAGLLHCAPAAPAATPAPQTPQATARQAGPKTGPKAAQEAAPADAAPAAVDFAALLQREWAPIAPRPVADPKGRWRAQLEARVAPVVEARGSAVVIRADVGTKASMICWVHDEQIDPSLIVSGVLEASGSAIEIQDASVYRLSQVAEIPIVALSVVYATKTAPPLGGELKLAVSPRPQQSLFCLHDEPGYRAAFARSVEGLARSLETEGELRVPQYSSIWKTQAGDVPSGYSWERIYAEADGTMLAFTFDFGFSQGQDQALSVRSEVAVRAHDRAGISKANFLAYTGTRESYEIELTRGADGTYAYSGKQAGKEVHGKVDAEGALAGRYELLLQLLGRGTESKSEAAALAFEQREYDPQVSLERAVDVQYALDAERRSLRVSRPGDDWTYEVDAGALRAARSTSSGKARSKSVLTRRSSLGTEPGVALGERPIAEREGPPQLARERREFVTQVFAETARQPAAKPPAKLLSLVKYPTLLGENVAYVSPRRGGDKRPAIIWIPGGFDWSVGESAWAPAPRDNDQSARALREAGLVLMLPALRGSNDNPGQNECFFGEVDDVIAALDYLAKRPDVDPERIYLGGHSTGGTLALLVAASTDRFRGVFAFGPVADVRQYGAAGEGGCLPADAAEAEVRLRAPIHFVSDIHTPTFVFEGAANGNVDALEALREVASERVHFTLVPGADHFSILAPGTEVIARAILSGKVDDSSLVITP